MKLQLTLIITLLACFSADGQKEISAYFKDVTSTHLPAGLSDNTMDAAAVDIDQDGDLDLILAIEYKKNRILINDGNGKFTDESSQRLPGTARDSEDIAVADFDGDGDIDIVFVSEDDQTNEYYRNDGAGFFTDISFKLQVKGTSNAVEAADFDQDGDIDLLIGNAGGNYYLVNDGQGNFKNHSKTRLPAISATTQDIDIGDIDMDGDLDAIVANETTNYLLINDGKGIFSTDPSLLPNLSDQTREADFGDLDNDGDLDLVFANVDFDGIGDPQNRLLLNDGNGKYTEMENALPKSSLRTVDMDLVDINGDSLLDILSGNRFNGNEKLVLIQQGNLKFVDQTTAYFPELSMYVFDFQVADFNNDGILDIYLCGFRGEDKLLISSRP